MKRTSDLEKFDKFVSPEPMTGCWLRKGASGPMGHGAVRSKGLWRGSHRVSWELFVGPIPDGMHVLHKCDVPPCVNPDHLFLGTHLDNMRDKTRKNRAYSKLDRIQVEEIRSRYISGNGAALAREFGVDRSLISAIVNRKIWIIQ